MRLVLRDSFHRPAHGGEGLRLVAEHFTPVATQIVLHLERRRSDPGRPREWRRSTVSGAEARPFVCQWKPAWTEVGPLQEAVTPRVHNMDNAMPGTTHQPAVMACPESASSSRSHRDT